MRRQSSLLSDRLNQADSPQVPDKAKLEEGMANVFGTFRSVILQSPQSEKHMEVTKSGNNVELKLFADSEATTPAHNQTMSLSAFVKYLFEKLVPGKNPGEVFSELKEKGLLSLPKNVFGRLAAFDFEAGALQDRLDKSKAQEPKVPDASKLEEGMANVFGTFRSVILQSPHSEKHMEVAKDGNNVEIKLFADKQATTPTYNQKLSLSAFVKYLFEKLVPGQNPGDVFSALKEKGLLSLPKNVFGSVEQRVKLLGGLQAKRAAVARREKMDGSRVHALSLHKKNFRIHVYNVEQHAGKTFKVIGSQHTGHRVAFNEKVSRDELMECLKTAGLVKKSVANKEITVKGDFDLGYTFAYKGIPQFKILPEN